MSIDIVDTDIVVSFNSTYGDNEINSTDIAKTFGQMVHLAYARLKSYHSDLFHDATFLNDTWRQSDVKSITFWWGVCSANTFITTNPDLAYLSCIGADAWRFEIVNDDNETTVTYTRIKPLKES